MIELFISDIDGCLSVPFRPLRLKRIAELRKLIRQSQTDAGRQGGFPRFSLCSGRSYGYVEAMTQVLAIDEPVLFESAGGMIFPDTMRFHWHPDFSVDLDREVTSIRAWYEQLIEGSELWIDRAKRTQAGIAGPIPAISDLIEQTRTTIQSNHKEMVFTFTPVSIDVVPSSLVKEAGIRWLSEVSGVSLQNMAYIGDANADIGALQLVGHSFAPANAAADVKSVVDTVTVGSDIDGVIEAYRTVISGRSHPVA